MAHPTVDPDLKWFLAVAPSFMGLRSTHGGIVAALEGGGARAFDSSASQAQVERARPHVARARRLGTARPGDAPGLDHPLHAALLMAPWRPLASWRCSEHFTAVAMSMTTDRARLELACCHGTLASNLSVIRRERGEGWARRRPGAPGVPGLGGRVDDRVGADSVTIGDVARRRSRQPSTVVERLEWDAEDQWLAER